MYSPFTYGKNDDPPFEFVETEISPDATLAVPLRDRILVHTVHDGDVIPDRFRVDASGSPLVDPEDLERRFVQERDWGANLVARELASQLGIAGYGRCKIARVLLDFNRFPGSTPPSITEPLERLAINTPFVTALDHQQKMSLLKNYYDQISDLIEERSLVGKLIMIGVHTYDEHNASLTQRPDISVMYQAAGYQRESRMPYGVFDPLYPDLLGESTCSPILRDRISLNLERTGFRVSHNHPYPLPEGSMEVRAQVWYFFLFLKESFEAEFPETKEDEAYRMVWTMLQNTNLRLAEGEALRSYLHRYRRMPFGKIESYQAAERAYAHVSRYLDNSTVVEAYQRSPDRPSSLAIEVRKDLVCDFDPETGRPLPLSQVFSDRAQLIAKVIAGAVATYFETDRQFV